MAWKISRGWKWIKNSSSFWPSFIVTSIYWERVREKIPINLIATAHHEHRLLTLKKAIIWEEKEEEMANATRIP